MSAVRFTSLHREFGDAAREVIHERVDIAGQRCDCREITAFWLGHLEAVNGCGLEEIVRAAYLAESSRLEGRYQCSQEGHPRDGHRGECDWRCILDLSEFAAALVLEASAKGRGPSQCTYTAHDHDTENTCEHGDHPAPVGSRFCSLACDECESSEERGDDDCAGICGRSWFDEHEPFTLPAHGEDIGLCKRCGAREPGADHLPGSECGGGMCGAPHQHHPFVQRGSAFIIPPLVLTEAS